MTVKKCYYGVCKNDSRREVKGITYHRFPNPKKQFIKFEKWIINSGWDLAYIDKFDYKNKSAKYICSQHFTGESGPTISNPHPIPLNGKVIIWNERRKLVKVEKNPLNELVSESMERSSPESNCGETHCKEERDEVTEQVEVSVKVEKNQTNIQDVIDEEPVYELVSESMKRSSPESNCEETHCKKERDEVTEQFEVSVKVEKNPTNIQGVSDEEPVNELVSESMKRSSHESSCEETLCKKERDEVTEQVEFEPDLIITPDLEIANHRDDEDQRQPALELSEVHVKLENSLFYAENVTISLASLHEEPAEDINFSLSSLREELLSPMNWFTRYTNDYAKFSIEKRDHLTLSYLVYHDMTTSLNVLGKDVSTSHDIWKDLKTKINSATDVLDSLSTLNTYFICNGNLKEDFKDVNAADINGTFCCITEAYHSPQCGLIFKADGRVHRCQSCKKLRKTLRMKKSRQRNKKRVAVLTKELVHRVRKGLKREQYFYKQNRILRQKYRNLLKKAKK